MGYMYRFVSSGVRIQSKAVVTHITNMNIHVADLIDRQKTPSSPLLPLTQLWCAKDYFESYVLASSGLKIALTSLMIWGLLNELSLFHINPAFSFKY